VKKEKKTFFEEKIENNPLLLYGGAAGAVIVVLLLGFKMMSRGASQARAQQQAAIEAPAPAYDRVSLSHAAHSQTEGTASSQTLQLPPPRVEVITSQLRESVTRDAELWAGVLRAWLAEEENA
jgi:flagellar biosynthesis/type III secretory pathway M-ring protein FliF/YscJ